MVNSRWTWPALLALGAGLLVVSAMGWIGVLGLEYDEAHFLPSAVKIAQGAEEYLPLPWALTVAHRPIPLMTMPYVGAGDALLYALAYRVFGVDIGVARWVNLALGIGVLWLALVFVRREGGMVAAGFAALLLLVDLEWLLHVPTNFGPFLWQQVLGAGALYGLSRWWAREGDRWFYLAVGLLALAFHEKLTFLWVLSSLGAGMMLFRGKASWKAMRWWTPAVGLLLAIVVVSPILYFVWSSPEVVLGFGKQSTKVPTEWGRVLGERLHILDLMFRGTWTMEFTSGPTPIVRGPGMWLLFGAGLMACLWARQTMGLMLYFVAAGVFAWNLIFPDAGRMHHLLLIVPYWQCGAALGFADLGRVPRALLVLLLFWSGFDTVRCLQLYREQVQRTHGVNHWSDMTSRVAEWMLAHPEMEAVTTSWGLARPVYVLSGGRVDMTEHTFDTMSDAMPADTVRELGVLLGKQRVVWFVSSVMPYYGEQFERIRRMAAERGKNAREVVNLPSADGKSSIRGYQFGEADVLPRRWELQNGNDVKLLAGWKSVKVTIAGVADEEDEDFTLEWKNASGEVLWSDGRPLRWFPLLGPRRELEFGMQFWPRRFHRNVSKEGEAASVTVRTKFRSARVEKVELGFD